MWTEFHVKSTDNPLVQEDPIFVEEIKKLTKEEYVQEVGLGFQAECKGGCCRPIDPSNSRNRWTNVEIDFIVIFEKRVMECQLHPFGMRDSLRSSRYL